MEKHPLILQKVQMMYCKIWIMLKRSKFEANIDMKMEYLSFSSNKVRILAALAYCRELLF